jgi:hypothetical protein
MWTSSDLEVMQESIRSIVEVIKTVIIAGTAWAVIKVVEFSETELFQNAMSSAIFECSRIQTNIYLWSKEVYQEYYVAKVIIDAAVFAKETYVSYTSRKRLEPSGNWVQICSSHYLTRGYHIGDGAPIYTESYRPFQDSIDLEPYFQTCYENNRDLCVDNKEYENRDALIIARLNDKYRVLRCATAAHKPSVFPMESSTVHFLSAEYFAKKESAPIVLQIPKTMYISNNELFSPGFVRRALEYQNDPFEFNANYIIKIMDSNLNQFELDQTKYIRLGESEYSIENA